MKRKGNYKFEIGDLVRFRDKKAKVIDRFWDERSSNRYEVRFMVGRNLTGDSWSVKERNLEKYKSRQDEKILKLMEEHGKPRLLVPEDEEDRIEAGIWEVYEK